MSSDSAMKLSVNKGTLFFIQTNLMNVKNNFIGQHLDCYLLSGRLPEAKSSRKVEIRNWKRIFLIFDV